MTGLVRKATLLVVGGLLIAGVAMAGQPSFATSTIPTTITIVDGSAVGLPPSVLFGLNSFVINDATPSFVANAEVTLQFNACITPESGIELCNTQPDPSIGMPGVTFGVGEILSYNADGAGVLQVRVVGTGLNITPLASGRQVCCQIYANSVPMGGPVVVTVVNYDIGTVGDPVGGPYTHTTPLLNGLDGSFWLFDFSQAGSPTFIYNSRSDYDGNGSIGGVDGALWLNAFNNANWVGELPCTLIP